MDEGSLWEVASFCYPHPEREDAYAPGDRERFQRGYRRRADYLRMMLPRGGRVQIAYREGQPVGFIEYYPIEITNLEVDGQGFMAIWCINVREGERNRGIGSSLVKACLDDARGLGRKGVVVTCWDPFWMPKSIFEHHGFTDVGQAGGGGKVFCKAFAETRPPRWIGRKPTFHPLQGRTSLVLDIYHTDRCPLHWRNLQLVLEVAEEFAPRIVVRKHPTDERAKMRGYGTAFGIYLNGRLIVAGPMASRAGIREKVEEELQRL